MRYFYTWWASVPGWAKPIILTAVVGLSGWVFTRLVPSMIRWFCAQTLLKLKSAEKQIHVEQKLPKGIIDVDSENFPIPLEQIARKAHISMWRANWAMRHDELRRKLKQW